MLPANISDHPDRTIVLKSIKDELCQYHFGIEKEVQRLLDAFAPWHLFPGTQQRPRTIGLWGMTGTGKSSLVRALVRKLGVEEITFWLDAGECHSHYWMDLLFGRLEEHFNGKPFIVVVDEFQHARTKGNGKPEPAELRRFWEFLDAGRVVTWPNIYHMNALIDLIERISEAIGAGVMIRNGKVVEGEKMFDQLVRRHYSQSNKGIEKWAIPVSEWDTLRQFFVEPHPSLPALEKMLGDLDGPGLIALLQRLRRNAQRPNVVDARQALVILLGNLDALYITGTEPIAEVDPDVLLHRHKDIGTSGVHNALLRMFRIEQVARMGNDHVIFPPLGKNTIDRLIGHEVDALMKRLSISCGRRLSIDPAVVERIKDIPAPAIMGARPVIEAVQRIVPILFSQALQKCPRTFMSIHLSIKDEDPLAVISTADRSQEHVLHWPEGLFRKCSRLPDELERFAVHEAGHLICGIALCDMKPLQACSRTTDAGTCGFVIWDEPRDGTMTRDRIVPELARLLGGMAAEHVRYGKEKVSAGGSSDLRSATEFALAMAKTHGLGRDKLFHAHHPGTDNDGFRTGLDDAEDQVRQWMVEAEQLAIDTINVHSRSFKAIIDALIEKGSLGITEIEALLLEQELILG